MKTLLLNRVENIVAKGEIAHYEQFLLLLQCLQKSSAEEDQKGSVCGIGLTNFEAHSFETVLSKLKKIVIVSLLNIIKTLLALAFGTFESI